MRGPAGASHPTPVDQIADPRSTSVDHSLVVLRQVVSDLGYTLDSLHAAMGKDRSFIHKVLYGEKPLPQDVLVALPDDIEAEWHARRAESLGGRSTRQAGRERRCRGRRSGLRS